MTSSKKDLTKKDSAAVAALIERLEEPLRSLVAAIRATILEANDGVGEQVKWNSASFFWAGEMADFDPKTYARDIVVVDARRGSPMLVFPSGAKILNENGFLEGDFKDGRRLVRIENLAELEVKKGMLQAAVRSWILQIEKG